ncbi:MAG: DUF4173 domain-containing protein [Planctomycetota bacterium]
MSHQRRWLRFGFFTAVTAALISAALADFLFYESETGWTVGAFIAWVAGLLVVRHRRVLFNRRNRVWGGLLAGYMVGVCASAVLEPGVLAGVLAFLGLASLALLGRSRSGNALLGWGWLAQLLTVWVTAVFRPILDTYLINRWHRRFLMIQNRVLAKAKLFWGVLGVVVPLGFTIVFVSLFAIANPVLDQWIGEATEWVGDFLMDLTEYVTLSRVLIWLVAGVLCWGLLRYRRASWMEYEKTATQWTAPVSKPAAYDDEHPIHVAAERKRERSPNAPDPEPVDARAVDLNTPPMDMAAWVTHRYQNVIARCLIAMNIVFALQLTLDSRYLVFGGDLPDGMTYAEYAHRGAYPLVFTALLAAVIVLVAFRPGGVSRRNVWVFRLVFLWIIQNVLLVISAALRLSHYVEAYTLTRLRVAAAVWMLLVAGGLVLLIWRIASDRDNTWLTRVSMAWTLCILWASSFIPFDIGIAQYNALNCREMGGKAGPIDLAYLQELGPDALPAINLLLDKLPSEIAGRLSEQSDPNPSAWIETFDARYEPRAEDYGGEQTLQQRLEKSKALLTDELDQQLDDWRGWTVRRAWLQQSAD